MIMMGRGAFVPASLHSRQTSFLPSELIDWSGVHCGKLLLEADLGLWPLVNRSGCFQCRFYTRSPFLLGQIELDQMAFAAATSSTLFREFCAAC